MVVSNSLASQGLKPPTGFRRETANPICGDSKGWAVCLANYILESRTLYFLLIHPNWHSLICLVVWNMNGLWLSTYWEPSSQLTNSIIFQRGRSTTKQLSLRTISNPLVPWCPIFSYTGPAWISWPGGCIWLSSKCNTKLVWSWMIWDTIHFGKAPDEHTEEAPSWKMDNSASWTYILHWTTLIPFTFSCRTP